MSRGRLPRGRRQCACGRMTYGRSAMCDRCREKPTWRPGRPAGREELELERSLRARGLL